MDTKNLPKFGTLALGIALAAAAIPGAAVAQQNDLQGPGQGPQQQQQQGRPSYASPGEDTVRGRVISVDGDENNITVRDANGYVDHVSLHQGTIINPTGLTLRPGMTVTILGVNRGNQLAANEIDTPYNYAPGYGYGYPGYGYPPVAVGLDFGFGGWGRGRWR